jgi:hypothetical protein
METTQQQTISTTFNQSIAKQNFFHALSVGVMARKNIILACWVKHWYFSLV